MEITLNKSKLKASVDFKKLTQNLFDFKVGSFITEVLSVKSETERLAYTLLFNSTKSTNLQLSKIIAQEQIDKNPDVSKFFIEQEFEWDNFFEKSILITKDFFDNPIQFSPKYLKKSFELFKKYIVQIGGEIPHEYEYKYYISYRRHL